ncbi:MAG: alpha-N-arabinofuranosidase [Lentisphaerae bacterium]|nr:alpha-N-arabinofuranosidase [Lentisphaerota bacterium]
MSSELIIHADQGATRISRHLYGQFAEHLGTCIYGGLWVGESSPIPNIRGIRRDVLSALRELRIPNLRWPGGCFAESYHWRDGIGPREGRPVTENGWGGIRESNQFGTHEFMDLCDLLGAQPYICGNMSTGSPEEMADWLEYITAAGDSRLAQLRARNGRVEPWPLTYWAVGNENWGCGGHMTVQQYTAAYRRFQPACRNFSGARLYKVACGWEDDWNEALMRDAGTLMDGLSIHHYSRTISHGQGGDPASMTLHGQATRFDAADWWHILRKATYMDGFITRMKRMMDRYDAGGRVGLIVDEWGTWYKEDDGKPAGSLYQQNTIRDALVAAVTLNIFHRHADRVHMANIAQMVNVLQAMVLTDGPHMLRTPTFHVFEMNKVHQGAVTLPADLTCAEQPVDIGTVPVLSASASRADSGEIHVTLCNLDPETPAALSCDIRGLQMEGAMRVSARVLTADTMQAHNTFDAPDAVVPIGFDDVRIGGGGTLELVLPAKSVVVLTVQA